MGYVAGGHVAGSRLHVALLVVEEDIGAKGLEELALGQSAEEQRLIDADVPGPESADHPFVGRCRTRRDQRSADRRVVQWVYGLDAVQRRQEVLERPAAQGLARLSLLAGGEGREPALLVHALRFVGE